MSESNSLISPTATDFQEIGQVLFKEIRQIINTAKQHTAIAINEEIIHLNNQRRQLYSFPRKVFRAFLYLFFNRLEANPPC
jgi:division protein CdvB (Snf7/Vps24/ESCRT-III family)